MRYPLLISLILLLSTCRKVHRSNPKMIGEWIHYVGNGRYEKMKIDPKSKGYYYYYTNIDDIDTHEEIWIVIADELHFKRRKPKIFKINELPKQADKTTIYQYDTITFGIWYMKLNNNYFKRVD